MNFCLHLDCVTVHHKATNRNIFILQTVQLFFCWKSNNFYKFFFFLREDVIQATLCLMVNLLQNKLKKLQMKLPQIVNKMRLTANGICIDVIFNFNKFYNILIGNIFFFSN